MYLEDHIANNRDELDNHLYSLAKVIFDYSALICSNRIGYFSDICPIR